MKNIILTLVALLYGSSAIGQDRPNDHVAITGPNSAILVKLTSALSATTSKPGDVVTGEVIDPWVLRGAHMEGTIDRADHSILNFNFHTLRYGGNTYRLGSKLMSVTSSHGTEGQDDLDQRVRIEGAAGAGIIAYGVTTALNKGAEFRLTIWEK